MKELKELEHRLRKLKEENEARKKTLKELKSDRSFLTEKNRYLAERIKEASVAYSNAGRRILDFVETQVKPVKKKLEKFDSIYRKIAGYERSVSEGLGKIEGFEGVLNSLKAGLFNLEKKQTEFDSVLKDLSGQTGRIGDAVLRLEGMKVDSGIVDKNVSELGKTMNDLKDNFNSSVVEMRDEFQSSLDSLREDVDKLSERKEEKLGKDISEVEKELSGRIKEAEKGFNVAVKELGEGFGKLGERLARMESVKVGGKEVGEKIRSLEKGISDVEDRLNEKTKNLNDMLLSLKAAKGDSKIVDEKIRSIENSINLIKNSFNEGIARMKEGFWDNLDSLREDVDKLSGKKEKGMKKDISEVEKELNKRIDDINLNFKELGTMVLKLEGVKVDSKIVDEKVSELGKGINDLKDGFQRSLDSLREDVDGLSERKEEKLGKDITEVEEDFSGKINEVESDLNIAKNNFDVVINSLRKEIKRGESVKKEEINRIVREFFGIRAQIEERMKQLTEHFDQLDKFKEEFRNSFEKRVTGSEVSLKGLGDALSKMENHLKVIGERSVVNENQVKEMGKEFKESAKNLENKIDSVSSVIKSLKKESSKELDRLIEEAEG